MNVEKYKMSKADLSETLVDAAGGTRRKASSQSIESAKRNLGSGAAVQPSRAGTKPITVHFPKEVRNQLKILAVEQGITLQALVGESFNMLFAKYGKPEVAPTERTTTIHP